MAEALDKKHAQVDIIKENFPGITDEGIQYVLANIDIEGGGGRETAYPLNDGKNSMFDLSDEEGTRGGYFHNIPTARVFMVENGYAVGEIYDRGEGTMDVRPGTFKRNEKSSEYDGYSNDQKLGVMYNGDPDKPAGGFGPLQITLGKVAGGEEREKQLRTQYEASGHEGNFNSYLEKIENDDNFGLSQTLQFYKVNDPGNWNAQSISSHEDATGLGAVINPNRGMTDSLNLRYQDGIKNANDTMGSYYVAYPPEIIEDNQNNDIPTEGIDADEPTMEEQAAEIERIKAEEEKEIYVPPSGDIEEESLITEVQVEGNEIYNPPQGEIQEESLVGEVQVEGNVGQIVNTETNTQESTVLSPNEQITDPEINGPRIVSTETDEQVFTVKSPSEQIKEKEININTENVEVENSFVDDNIEEVTTRGDSLLVNNPLIDFDGVLDNIFNYDNLLITNSLQNNNIGGGSLNLNNQTEGTSTEVTNTQSGQGTFGIGAVEADVNNPYGVGISTQSYEGTTTDGTIPDPSTQGTITPITETPTNTTVTPTLNTTVQDNTVATVVVEPVSNDISLNASSDILTCS